MTIRYLILAISAALIVIAYDQALSIMATGHYSAQRINMVVSWAFYLMACLPAAVVFLIARQHAMRMALLMPFLMFVCGYIGHGHLLPIECYPGVVLHRLEVFSDLRSLWYLVAYSWGFLSIAILVKYALKHSKTKLASEPAAAASPVVDR